MNEYVDTRAIRLAKYIIKENSTVRATAKKFGFSKSTVHKDLSFRLKFLDLSLYNEVKVILAKNKAERHIRGGLATKHKYEQKTQMLGK